MQPNTFIEKSFMVKEQEKFFRAYIEALYFTETGDFGQPEVGAGLYESSLKQAWDDCRRFYNVYADIIGENVEQAGHDFWFTRNGHGTGFWDRPDVWGDYAGGLARGSHLMGEVWPEFEV